MDQDNNCKPISYEESGLRTSFTNENDHSAPVPKKDAGVLFPGEFLPDLVLDKILGFLPIPAKVNVEYVCKRWLDASRRSWIHVKEFDVSQHLPNYPMDDFLVLMQRMPSLRVMKIDDRFQLAGNSVDVYQAMSRLCPELVSLAIENSLEILNILGKKTDDLSVRHCGQQLRRLKLVGIYNLDPAVLKEAFELCPKLNTLAIDDCYMLGRVPLPPKKYSASKDTGDGLSELLVSHCPRIDDRLFDSLLDSAAASTLKVLSIDFCRGITGNGLAKIGLVLGHGKLERFSLRNCLKDVNFNEFFNRGNNNLRHLDLSFNSTLTDQTIVTALQFLPALEHISLYCCQGVTNLLPNVWFREDHPFGPQFGDGQPINRRQKHTQLRLDVFETRMSEQPKRQNFAWTFNFEDEA